MYENAKSEHATLVKEQAHREEAYRVNRGVDKFLADYSGGCKKTSEEDDTENEVEEESIQLRDEF